MPLLFFLVLVLLVAQLGFWKALGAVIGAVAMFGLLFVLVIALVICGGFWIAARTRARM
jgi:hypothetical protein